jgi:hypothetical protein
MSNKVEDTARQIAAIEPGAKAALDASSGTWRVKLANVPRTVVVSSSSGQMNLVVLDGTGSIESHATLPSGRNPRHYANVASEMAHPRGQRQMTRRVERVPLTRMGTRGSQYGIDFTWVTPGSQHAIVFDESQRAQWIVFAKIGQTREIAEAVRALKTVGLK